MRDAIVGKAALCLLWLTAALPSIAPGAGAATIERHDHPVMGCSIRLSGVIEEGDAERLKALIEARDAESLGEDQSGFLETFGNPITRRICLDSPGGSFREGARLARVIRSRTIGTAIPAGATCDSACAIVFMAGSYFEPEGEVASNNRVLHPQGRLGFHAPRLVLEGRSYSAEETEQAYEVALQSIAEVLELRSQVGYSFAESLFLAMLRTPHDQMLRPATVGDAARWGIALAPVGWPEKTLEQAVRNVCVNAEAAANDAEHDTRDYWSEKDLTQIVAFRSTGARGLDARIEQGFGREASGHCEVALWLADWSTGPFGFTRVEADTGRQHRGDWYLFQAHAPDTPIAALPYWSDAARSTLSEQITRERRGASRAGEFSCWLHSSSARVVNVSEYVNLRRQPGFSAEIIRRVPLGEQIRALRADNITVIGRDRQSCINACQAFNTNRQDHAARDRVQQCIEDNLVWHEITDARGNRGWVSRKFLQSEG